MSGFAIRNPALAAKLARNYAEMFDGQTPVSQRVSITVGDQTLELTHAETGVTHSWPLDALRSLPDQAASNTLVVARGDDHTGRLVIRDIEAARAILNAAPDLPPLRGPRGGWRRVGIMGMAAIGALAGIIFGLIPIMADQGARFIPPEAEAALGQTIYTQIHGAGDTLECIATPGLEALEKMQRRLMAGTDLPYPLNIRVVLDPAINAFALPGGHIILNSGLIDAAGTPDEVAAVLAHEIGHVDNRDGTRAVLRSVGSFGLVGLAMGDVFGGSIIAGLGRGVLDSSYSRAAEERADAYAVTMLQGAGVYAGALASFFERLQASGQDMDLGVFQHLSSHPDTLARITAARAADTGAGQPILSPASWAALQGVCAQTTAPGADR